jgi:hypothetical protein
MKRIVNEDLGICSRVIHENPVMTIDACKKCCKRGQKVAPVTPSKFAFFWTKNSSSPMP